VAEAKAINAGYLKPFVIFDEHDGPAFLFQHQAQRRDAEAEEIRRRAAAAGYSDSTLAHLAQQFIVGQNLGEDYVAYLDECAGELRQAALASDGKINTLATWARTARSAGGSARANMNK